ncbi:MAG: glycosyltransferase [Patescibacteria group bacterium]|jgi:cellulose synthase/poly-beta-1,6-N-acetylglucosamine synthase-like glycosyltransferase
MIIILIICIALQVIRGIPELVAVLNYYLHSGKTKSDNKAMRNTPFFYIFIPVLGEQRILRKTVNKILSINYPKNKYQIVIITTQKEFLRKEKVTTIEIAQRIKEDINNKYNKTLVNVFHYPHTDGYMVHQVNYALRKLYSPKRDKAYMALYNADSCIPKDTFIEAASIIKDEGAQVLQQLALYVNNFKEFNSHSFFKKYLLRAGGLYQSTYTVGRELPLITNYTRSLARRGKAKLAYCIGHGMIINFLTLRSIGWLPEETYNEDLPLGYQLSAKRIPIYVLKLFERAETPNRFRSIINQKKIWFWSYLEYPRLFGITRKKMGIKSSALLVLVFRGLVRGLSWYTLSIIYLIPIIITLWQKEWLLLAVTITLMVLLQLIPNFLVGLTLNDSTKKYYNAIITSLFSIIILFTDSVGPWLASVQYLIKSVSNVYPEKNKTER